MKATDDASDDLVALLGRVRRVVNDSIRPQLQAEGGDIEVVGIDPDRIVQVRLLGSCLGCSSASISAIMDVESTLKKQIPEVRFVEAVL